eukprot:scaffold3300_cov269-Prasinococcus_capsulatus_cf.AAC.2
MSADAAMAAAAGAGGAGGRRSALPRARGAQQREQHGHEARVPGPGAGRPQRRQRGLPRRLGLALPAVPAAHRPALHLHLQGSARCRGSRGPSAWPG